jgi:hypothetical protein
MSMFAPGSRPSTAPRSISATQGALELTEKVMAATQTMAEETEFDDQFGV